ncbi:MAG: hypothetical protein FD163_1740 [Hyphomonadaceae bacterium]|nr:MAG: hypothetical protein FD128_408 [Hyphomonadaceae bacterium]KAF0185043.1 MAG: hypothetical protein FD163_1740 [Hyphomonadaceae bacterium]
MTKDEFKTWHKSMGFTQEMAGIALGLGRSSIVQYEQGYRRDANKTTVGIPLTVALACAALSAGLAPYPTTSSFDI